MEEIILTDEELSFIRDGDILYRDIDDMLTIQIKEYTIGEQIADETEEDEIIFEPDFRRK